MNNWKKPFAMFCGSQAFTIIGASIVQFAVTWWITLHTQSAIMLSLAFVAGFLPNMILGPFAGVWIDRLNRRNVLIVADILLALTSVTLGAAFLLNEAPPLWFIFSMLVLRGLANTFHGPAMLAAVPQLVPEDMLTKAGGWGHMIRSAASMVGPVAGAALMNVLPVATIMLVDIISGILAIVCLLFIKIPDIVSHAQEKVRVLADMKLGFAALRENKPLLSLFPVLIAMSLITMPLWSFFPLLVRVHYAGTVWHNSAAEVLFSVGLVASSLVLGVWGGMKRKFLMIALALAVMAITTIASGLLPMSLFWIFLVCCFVMGGAGSFIQVPIMAHAQGTLAPENMGKVLSLFATAGAWVVPVGMLIGGPITESIGVAAYFVAAGVALLGVAVFCYAVMRKHENPSGELPLHDESL
ncbi:MAG: MFS transporter [Oscillospiraceae bacterium]|nr:MFS transporter [Oscillospiraceae bacterium]